MKAITIDLYIPITMIGVTLLWSVLVLTEVLNGNPYVYHIGATMGVIDPMMMVSGIVLVLIDSVCALGVLLMIKNRLVANN